MLLASLAERYGFETVLVNGRRLQIPRVDELLGTATRTVQAPPAPPPPPRAVVMPPPPPRAVTTPPPPPPPRAAVAVPALPWALPSQPPSATRRTPAPPAAPPQRQQPPQPVRSRQEKEASGLTAKACLRVQPPPKGPQKKRQRTHWHKPGTQASHAQPQLCDAELAMSSDDERDWVRPNPHSCSRN